MWGQQGVTNKRRIVDQTAVVSVSSQAVTLPFNSLKTVGYLRGVHLYAPYQAGVAALNTGTLALPNAWQFPQLRQINSFRLQLQGIAPIYDVAGPDLGFLAYVGNGVKNLPGYPSAARLGYSSVTVPTANEYPFSFPTNQTGASSLIGPLNQYGPVVEYVNSGPTLNMGYGMFVPLSEFITFPNTPMGTGGGAAILSDAQLEMGLVFMQNNQQVLSPYINVASLYGPDPRSVLIATGNATATMTNWSWSLLDEFYDVPPNPADRPNGYQMAFVVTRTAVDRPVSSGIVSHSFKQAGMLLRAIYVLYNDSPFGTQVDPSLTPSATITLKSGASILKFADTFNLNQLRCVENYGTPPPAILVHDLMPDGTITDCIDTATLIDVRTEFTGISGSVTRLHVIEERLIPITTPS